MSIPKLNQNKYNISTCISISEFKWLFRIPQEGDEDNEERLPLGAVEEAEVAPIQVVQSLPVQYLRELECGEDGGEHEHIDTHKYLVNILEQHDGASL